MKSLLPHSLAFILLPFLTVAAQGSDVFSDATFAWHMKDSTHLKAEGAAKTGIKLEGEDLTASLARNGDGYAAKLDGGHLVITRELGTAFDAPAYTLHLRVKPAGDTLDGCLFSRWAGREHMPVDFSAWRMPWGHLSTRGIAYRTSFKRTVAAGQAAVLDFFCPTPEPLAGWLDLTVRLTPQTGGAGVLDLFVNGALVFRNAEKLPGGLPFEFFLHETPGAILGAEPGGRWPFRGLMDHAALWTRALSDAEILQLAGVPHTDGVALKPQRVHHRDALGQYHLPPGTPDAERARLTNDELRKAIAHQIANDPWYPQFHIALVGLVCNLHALHHGGRHHLMLIHRGEALNHNEVFRHLVSDDLVSWDIRPAPLGWPHPIWPNGTFLVGADGKASIVGGYPITLATAEDDALDVWKVRNDDVRVTREYPRYVSEPRASPGKLSWEEGVTWRAGDAFYMAGGGSHWDSIEDGKLKRHHHDAADYDFPLYRSADLREWQHVGSFFKNPDPARLNLGVECGQMIRFGDGRWLWDFTHTYLVGRIEGERFVMQHAGTLAPKANFTHWGGWLRDNTGRVVFQTTKLLKLPVPELARLGWGRTHRLPLAATFTKDNRLVLQPIAELAKLRREHFALSQSTAVGAHHEIRVAFTASDKGQTGIRLSDGRGTLDIFFDAAKQQLVLDPRRLPDEANHIPNDKRLFTQPLAAKPGDPITLRVFHDGALLEVFANDENSAHWAWFESPDKIQASIFARGAGSGITSADAWTMGGIWKSSEP